MPTDNTKIAIFEFAGFIMRFIPKFLTKMSNLVKKENNDKPTDWLDEIRALEKQEIKIIFDIGGNEGQTVKKMLNYFPSAMIFSFEPHTASYEKLKPKFQEYPNVFPIKLGIGDKEELLSLICHKSSVTNSFLLDNEESKKYITKDMSVIGSESCRITRIDTFCREHKIEQIDILKIDTQGFELKVLEGCGNYLKPNKIKYIFSEILFGDLYLKQSNFEDVYRLMKNAGYGIVDFYGKSKSGCTTIKWCDILFTKK